VFRSREEVEAFIEEYNITADLRIRESADADLGAVLADMLGKLRFE